MELKLVKEELSKNRIFLATPMYGGQCYGSYLKSVLGLQMECLKWGVNLTISYKVNESLITRARNYLADEFLESNSTHLLFIDADVEFDPIDVIAMLAMKKDIVGGPYPKKSINWRNVHKAAQKVPIEQADQLETVIGNYAFNPIAGQSSFNAFEPFQVMELGTGFMLIDRKVFEKFRLEYPHLRYRPDHHGMQHKYIHAFFDTVIDPKSHRYLSEDYFFCQMARDIGFEVWLCPWVKTTHVGTYMFRGAIPEISQLTGEL